MKTDAIKILHFFKIGVEKYFFFSENISFFDKIFLFFEEMLQNSLKMLHFSVKYAIFGQILAIFEPFPLKIGPKAGPRATFTGPIWGHTSTYR